MWTRYITTAGALVWIFGLTAVAAEPCTCSAVSNDPRAPPSVQETRSRLDPEYHSSEPTVFRGLALNMKETEAKLALSTLGYQFGRAVNSARDICDGKKGLGTVRFNQEGKIRKLEFSPDYFIASEIVLRKFADDLFSRYDVKTLKLSDDLCYPGVTCFRGISTFEKFLVLKIAGDIQVHISPR